MMGAGRQRLETELLVVGETEGGIAAAVRAAREGVDTIVAARTGTAGGVFPSLGAIETHYHGVRSPLLREVMKGIESEYRLRYGADSEQLRTAVARDPMVTFEPHVGEAVLRSICAATPGLRILWRHEPVDVTTSGRSVSEVRLRDASGNECVVSARYFVDASYTGDLTALAGVPCVVGRESRSQYGEAHAGRLFTRWVAGRFPVEAAAGRLNLVAKATTSGILSGSSGEGDDNVMSYSYRLCLTDDPANRVEIGRPPGYDRSRYLAISQDPEEIGTTEYALHHRFLTRSLRAMIEEDHLFHGHRLPNRKRSWNATNFTGAGKGYAAADQAGRRRIEADHLNHALGILYFLQNDSTVPPDIRATAQEWGLAADEFAATAHVPEQLYVREARRMLGRYTFVENDAIVPRGIGRAPVHVASIAVTEFPLDSLACTNERMEDSVCDGQFFLQELSRPGQIPYGVLLPREIDNLLAPGAASTSHVGWGTVRQSPTFMHLGESAGFACALARELGLAPADVPVSMLQRRLAERGVMLTFFNDADMAELSPAVSAAHALGARGFFPDYDARLDHPLSGPVARLWASAAAELPEDDAAALELARQVAAAQRDAGAHPEGSAPEQPGGGAEPVSAQRLADLVAGSGGPDAARIAGRLTRALRDANADAVVRDPRALTRGEACVLLYASLSESGRGDA